MTTKVIGMSGTPVMNRPADFWPILNIIRPELFPSFQSYAHRYCDPRKTHWGWEYKGAKNLEELHERVKPFMLRRLKENVLKLPSKTHVVVPLHLEDRSELDAAENDFIDWLSKNSRFGSVTSAQKAEAVRQHFETAVAEDLLAGFGAPLEDRKHQLLLSQAIGVFDVEAGGHLDQRRNMKGFEF